MPLLDSTRSYDFIGDVHGCFHTLEKLLIQLGYQKKQGIWRHSTRFAVFLGDLIDRGSGIRETVNLVHAMVEAQTGYCILGNHEFNALAWNICQADNPLQYVRKHTERNAYLIGQTLQQFKNYPNEWKEVQSWFYQLPLFIETDRFRAIHACWDQQSIELCRPFLGDQLDLTVDLIRTTALKNTIGLALNRLLRGTDMRLPNGMELKGDDGTKRTFFRTKFWEENPRCYDDIVFQPNALPDSVAQISIKNEEKKQLVFYDADQPLLFIGHYWRRGTPSAIRPNIACLDYSAVMKGKLVAYRLDQENIFSSHKFVWVDVDERDLL